MDARSEETLTEMREALKRGDVTISLPHTFTHGRGVQLHVGRKKVGPILLRGENQTLAELLHMVGQMAETEGIIKPCVDIEPEQYVRMEALVERAKQNAPLTIETIVFLAIDAFLDGAEGED